MFEPAFSEARRVGAPRNIASRAERGELTQFFEMSSNFFENVHQKGNRRFARWGARNAPARCERPKGKIQIRREPP